jgi:BREX system ATP-binding protein BrxC/D
VRLAGYAGLLINIDEMGVFSHRLNSSQARTSNYEVILRILNDCLQGNVAGLGFLFGGTNTFLEDQRRGIFSYEALATRLGDNAFAKTGLKDFSGPVIRLQNLSPEDIFVLLHNIRAVFALGDPAKHLINDEGIKQFMVHCGSTLGADFFLTPRDAVKAFVGLLSVIDQNPGASWAALLSQTPIDRTCDPEAGAPDPDEDNPPRVIASKTDDDLTSFRL